MRAKPQDVGLHPHIGSLTGSGRRDLPPLRPHAPGAAVLIWPPAACIFVLLYMAKKTRRQKQRAAARRYPAPQQTARADMTAPASAGMPEVSVDDAPAAASAIAEPA